MTRIAADIRSGFFWGAGFAMAVLLITSLYMVFLERRLASAAEDFYRSGVSDRLDTLWDGLDLAVHDVYTSDTEVRVTATLRNTTNDNHARPEIIFDVFDENGGFLANCRAASTHMFVIPKDSIEHLEAVCKVSRRQAEQASYAEGRLVLR